MPGPAPFRLSGVLHTGASIHSAGTLRPGFLPLERQGAGAWEVSVLCRRPTGVSTRLSEGHLSPGLGPRWLCTPLTLSLLPWALGLSLDPLFSAVLESRHLPECCEDGHLSGSPSPSVASLLPAAPSAQEVVAGPRAPLRDTRTSTLRAHPCNLISYPTSALEPALGRPCDMLWPRGHQRT